MTNIECCLKINILIMKYSETFSFDHLYYVITVNKRTQFQDRSDKRKAQVNLIQTATCLMWPLLDDCLFDRFKHV